MFPTDTALRNAKPHKKSVKMFDERGLYLEVSPAGGKWWRLKYRFCGKEKRMSLALGEKMASAPFRVVAADVVANLTTLANPDYPVWPMRNINVIHDHKARIYVGDFTVAMTKSRNARVFRGR